MCSCNFVHTHLMSTNERKRKQCITQHQHPKHGVEQTRLNRKRSKKRNNTQTRNKKKNEKEKKIPTSIRRHQSNQADDTERPQKANVVRS